MLFYDVTPRNWTKPIWGVNFLKLTDEEKLEIVREIIENRKKPSEMCAKFHLNKETVNIMVARARVHGYDSIPRGARKFSYDREFKLKAVKNLAQGTDSKRAVSIIFGINKCTIRRWYAEYLALGDNAFMEDNRGKKKEGSAPRGQRPKNADTDSSLRKEVEQLRKQNKYLLMENEYLKKLDALVRERIERESGK